MVRLTQDKSYSLMLHATGGEALQLGRGAYVALPHLHGRAHDEPRCFSHLVHIKGALILLRGKDQSCWPLIQRMRCPFPNRSAL